MPRYPLIGTHGKGRSAAQNARAAINLYLESDEAGGHSQTNWINTPGLIDFSTTAGVVRGGIVANSLIYFVAGNQLYSVPSTGGTPTAIATATLTTSSGVVDMAASRSELCIVDGSANIYNYNFTSGFTTISAFSSPVAVTAIAYQSTIASIVVASSAGFAVGEAISTNGAGNGKGTVKAITGNTLTVSVTSGYFLAGYSVDNAEPYSSEVTTVTSVYYITYRATTSAAHTIIAGQTVRFTGTSMFDAVTATITNVPDTTHFDFEFATTTITGACTLVGGSFPRVDEYTLTVPSIHNAVVNGRVSLIGTTNFNNTYSIQSVATTLKLSFYRTTDPGDESGTYTVRIGPPDETGLTANALVTNYTPLTITPTRVEHMDGYFIIIQSRVNKADGVNAHQFYISEPEDGLTWNAANYGAAQRNPDALVDVISLGGDLFLIGEMSIEAWYNSGAGDFPFEPSRGATVAWGAIAAGSVCIGGNGLIWLGQRPDGSVFVAYMPAYSPERVSSHEINYRISTHSAAELAAATAFVYRDEGHEFYCLTVGNETLCLDLEETKKGGAPVWHERQSPTSTTAGVWRAKYHFFIGGKHIVSDPTNSKLLEITLANHQELDNTTTRAVTRTGIGGHIHEDDKWVFHHRVGLAVARTSGTYTITLYYSDDQGATWVSAGARTVGGSSASQQRIDWAGLGASFDRIYKVETSTTEQVIILDAYVDVSLGNA